MKKRNYYAVLGVSPEEDLPGIRKAFRQAVKKYHPDVVGPEWTTQYRDIVEAYEILSDPARRKVYNHDLFQSKARTGSSSRPIIDDYDPDSPVMAVEPISIMDDFLTAHEPWEALWQRFIRNFSDRNIPKAEQPQSLTVEIVLGPAEALSGVRLPLGVPVVYPCPYCDGRGEIWSFQCGSCRGQGLVFDEETVMIGIPPRVQSGTVYEIPLKGLGIHNLYLRVLIRIGLAD